MIFDLYGNRIDKKPILMGVIMTTDTDAKRFSAMKQLFDIGMKRLKNPNYVVGSNEFTDADKGIVCLYPDINTNFCEGYDSKILYEKNASVVAPTLSTVKVMTILTGLPYISSVCSERVTLQADDIRSGSGNYFYEGDILTVEDLIYGALLPSSNTCAVAYAHYVGSKILHDDSANFDQCMNAFYTEMARKETILGCTDSDFMSASGSDEQCVSTCKDLIKVLQASTLHQEITTIWNKKNYAVNVKGTNERVVNITTSVTNTSLESKYYILGGKTGSGGSGTLRALIMIATLA